MISKRIDRGGKTSSYGRLGRYVLEAKTDQAAILWTRTAEYVIDQKGAGEKVLWSRLSNCEAEVPIMAIAEIEATQAQNTRSQADKTYHFVVSFPEGEFPDRLQLEDIEDSLCEALGFGEHQRISAVHKDTENLHLHVAVNKVHPQTLKVLEPYRDYYIRDQACRKLEIKHGLSVDNGMGQGQRLGRAADLEAFQGEVSFLSWAQANLKEPLRQAVQQKSWGAVHQTLAEFELVMKPRGAGLVIGSSNGQLHIKASSVDRGFSFKALTDQLGPFQPSQQTVSGSQAIDASFQSKTYSQGPRQAGADAKALYQQYQSEKASIQFQKQQVWAQFKTAQREKRERLKADYQARRVAVKVNKVLIAKTKRSLYQGLSQDYKAALTLQRNQEAKQRNELKAQFPGFTWEDWLQQQVQNEGNMEALSILRRRARTRQQIGQALLTAENLEAAQHLLKPHVSQVQKNGAVVYRINGGGVVSDEAQGVRVPEISDGAALLALSLASSRFVGQALVVEGNVEFKLKVAELSALNGLAVKFSDADLEKTRQRFVAARALKQSNQAVKRAKKLEDNQHLGR